MAFTPVQQGPARQGTGSVTTTLGQASRLGTMLIAKVTQLAGSGFTSAPPGWVQAEAATDGASIDAELWVYPGNPGGITSALFVGVAGVDCEGQMSEHATTANTIQVIDGNPGEASGGSPAVSFPVAVAQGSLGAGDMAVSVFAAAFSSATGATWTTPSNWSADASNTTGTNEWAAYSRYGLLPQTVSVTGQVSTSANMTGWAACVAVFREVSLFTFLAMQVAGGEMLTMIAKDPSSGRVIGAGDVEGPYSDSSIPAGTGLAGDHWTPSQRGCYLPGMMGGACVAWSQMPADAGAVYILSGIGRKGLLGGGGFQVSADGGSNWVIRSTGTLTFFGSNTFGQTDPAPGPGPRPSGEAADSDRSVGRLLAQDPVNGYLYAATYNQGVQRSSGSPVGTNWSAIGLSASGYYPRAIVMNPSNASELWVGTWDSDNTGRYGGVWHTAQAQAANPSDWAQFGGASALTMTISDVMILGSYLYALAVTKGLFRIPLAGGTWQNVGGTLLDVTASLWTSMDGYIDGSGNHQIICACSKGIKPSGTAANYRQIVQVSIDGSGNVTFTAGPNGDGDLTAHSTINVATIPPDGRTWWQSAWAGYPNYLGGKSFANPHVLIDPADPTHQTIYIAGSSGFYRSYDGGSTWAIAINGMAMQAIHVFVIDPQNGQHIVLGSSDYSQIDVTDGVGYNATSTVEVANPSGVNTQHGIRALAFFADSTLVTGFGEKSGAKTLGRVFTRAGALSTGGVPSYSDTLYGTTVGGTTYGPAAGNPPIGAACGTDQNGVKWIVVSTAGAGIWRWSAATGQWVQANTTIGTGQTNGDSIPFAYSGSGAVLYVFDPASGIWRSSDYGQSWGTGPIWSVTCTNNQSGWIALNPAVPNQLWVTNGQGGTPSTPGIWRLDNAQSGTVAGHQITLTPVTAFPGLAGGIDVTPSGTVYAISLPTATQTSTQVYRSIDGGATWVISSDSSLGAVASNPQELKIAPNGSIYISSGFNNIVYSQPAAPATTPVTLLDTGGGATDAISVLGSFTDPAASTDAISVVGPPSNLPALGDQAGSADAVAVAVTEYPPLADVAASQDTLTVAITAPGPWIIPAALAGTNITLIANLVAVPSNVAPGQQFQLYGSAGLVQPDVFTITSL